MKSITLKNVSKSIHGDRLFADVSFSVKKGDRIAVTGKNGVGKSTLLKIILGTEGSDSGRVCRETTSCRYIPQEFSGNEHLSVLEYLDATNATVRVFDLLKQFEVIPENQIENGCVHELSGGQKRILEIAAVLSHSPMFLCIDEPENHLDMKTRAVLSEILERYWGAVIFVSHDRYLVNQIANKILSLQNERAVLMSGKSYEEFVAIENQHENAALADWKAEARVVQQLTENVRMLKARTRYNDAQAKTYQMKKRQLEERRNALGARPDRQASVRIKNPEVQKKTGKLIFSCTDMSFWYPEQESILQNVQIDLRFGDRVVLLGRNGTGKTTLLHLLQDRLQPGAGEARVGNDVAIRYIDQADTLNADLSPLEHLHEHGYTEEQARSLMAQFLFTQTQAESALKTLSGGEQKRFTFLFSFKTAPECLVLDEPTNNLDPETWELLLALINEYQGSLLLVSHDRSFVERVERKRIWVLQDRTVKESWDDLDVILRGL